MEHKVKCLLWDFGDTLCDEKFIWSSGPEWMNAYRSFDDGGIGAAWNLGELDTRGFAAELSKQMKLSADTIRSHMIERCRHIVFFSGTWAFFKARHLPQAIVTVNPDLFSEVIVPVCGLDGMCDTIVTSWQEQTADKNILNRLAIERMNLSCENHEALLIDNKSLNIDRWVSVGGQGYRYTDDAAFERNFAAGLESK